MATYFVASGGSNTAPYDTWAKAATSLQTALTAATATGDLVIIQYNAVPSGDAEVAADTTYTFAGNVSLISASNDGGSAWTPTEMGTANWIGNSTTNRGITFAGAFACYVYGLTLRISGSSADNCTLVSSPGQDIIVESCYFWQGNTATTAYIILSSGTTAANEYAVRCLNCTFRFGNTSQGLFTGVGKHIIEGGSVSSAGSAPSNLFKVASGQATQTIDLCGVDLSFVTTTLVPDNANGYNVYNFRQCKLGSGVTIMAAQTTVPNNGSVDVYVYDCASGDEHYHFQHHNALGSLTTDTGIYANAGASWNAADSKASWKIVTTANATYANPYISPWITVHHEGTSAITPNFECVRSGSSTAYNNDEVWSEWMFKGTSGFTLGTHDHSDRRTLAAAAAAQTTGALGASDWTGENATSWFGKLSPTATITPAELGDLCGRVVMGKASDTVYVDPTIRGRS